MKKLLLLTTLFLVGCAPTSTPTEPSKEPEVPPSPAEKLFVSEVYASNESTFGKAIELGYIGDFELNLEGYRLQIFSGKTLKKTITFTSNDVVSPNGTYVIANKTNDVYDYHSKANMILDDDYIFGSNVIKLVNPHNLVFEVFGSEMKYDYALYSSHLKLPVFYGPSTAKYDLLKYINVRVDENYSYLGNLECPFYNQQDVLDGPKITEELFSLPFEDGSMPGGGFAEVTLASCGDGDTTVFNFKDEYVNVDRQERTRYMNINTPEISHSPDGSGEEPWGVAAMKYNNAILKSAKKILVQSVKGYGFREVYGRLLGFVWYSNIENPTLSDYKLLNVEMVREGYAYFGGSDPLKELYSGDIYYNTYFDYAYLYAQNSGIRIHGEIDPDYDY